MIHMVHYAYLAVKSSPLECQELDVVETQGRAEGGSNRNWTPESQVWEAVDWAKGRRILIPILPLSGLAQDWHQAEPTREGVPAQAASVVRVPAGARWKLSR